MHLIILVEMVMDCMIRKLKVYLLIITAMTCLCTQNESQMAVKLINGHCCT
jgi:hypothetical protein